MFQSVERNAIAKWSSSGLSRKIQRALQAHALSWLGEGTSNEVQEYLLNLLRVVQCLEVGELRYICKTDSIQDPAVKSLRALLVDEDWLQHFRAVRHCRNLRRARRALAGTLLLTQLSGELEDHWWSRPLRLRALFRQAFLRQGTQSTKATAARVLAVQTAVKYVFRLSDFRRLTGETLTELCSDDNSSAEEAVTEVIWAYHGDKVARMIEGEGLEEMTVEAVMRAEDLYLFLMTR